MNKLLIFLFSLIFFTPLFSQEKTGVDQQLENKTDADETETEDDTYLQSIENFRSNPINLNATSPEELKELQLFTDLQIASLFKYISIFGKLTSIYEVQAIPAWDVETIRNVLPYIAVNQRFDVKENFSKWFSQGDHTMLFRVSQVLEKAKGFDKSGTGTRYEGSPQRFFIRYKYQYKNLLQYGITADKDAGESFFKQSQKKGFDFYSAHLFARNLGVIKSLAIGDFTLNMGQGLIQWQSLAFKKSSEVTQVKRQADVLRPYNSAGEFYFNRGLGVTIKKQSVEATVFASMRKLGANYVADTLSNEDYVSSLLTSGYHRTSSEIADKNNLRQTSYGATVSYNKYNFHLGVNAIFYNFSLPIQKRGGLYNIYALNGETWNNYSIDYGFTIKNVHVFGEAALDKGSHHAVLAGLIAGVDRRVDVSLVFRDIEKGYQAVYGNAFTENNYPSNEKGIYAGISIRLTDKWILNTYIDWYKFPWLKYLVDAPSYGRDYLSQLTYKPNKIFETYLRFRKEIKQVNKPENISVTNFLVNNPKTNLRWHINYKVNKGLALRGRVEKLWFGSSENNNSEEGLLAYVDVAFKPMMKPFSGYFRVQYFNTDSYNSRMYAYENDVQYSYSIPVSYDKGLRYYATLNYDISKKIALWLRIAQTMYNNKTTIGSGLDEIQGNRKTEVKFQVRFML